MVIGRCKLARGRPSGASSRDGGASSRRAAAGFPAISNNLLLERVDQHTVGVSGPPVWSTASAGAALALGATVSRYGGASSRRAAAGFPAISNDLSAERVDQHTVGVCGARVRSTASAGAALAPAPRRRARSETVAARAAGTELQRAAGQRRPFEPLGRGVTAGGPPGAHTSQDLACPRLILKRGVRATVASAPAFGNPEAICLTLTKAKFTHVLMASDESTRSRTKHAVRRTSKRHAMGM